MLHGHHAADDASQVAYVHLNGGKEQSLYAICNNSDFIAFTEFKRPKDEQKDSILI